MPLLQPAMQNREVRTPSRTTHCVTHLPIVDDNPSTIVWIVELLHKYRQVFFDARNSVKYICDVNVTQEAFDEAAEIGLSSEAQRVLHWRKSALAYIVMLWLFRLIVSLRYLTKARESFSMVLLELPAVVQTHATAFPSAMLACEALYVIGLIFGMVIVISACRQWRHYTRTRKMLRSAWGIVFFVPIFLLICYPYRNAVDWDAADGDICRETVHGIQQENRLDNAILQAKEFSFVTNEMELDYLAPFRGLDGDSRRIFGKERCARSVGDENVLPSPFKLGNSSLCFSAELDLPKSEKGIKFRGTSYECVDDNEAHTPVCAAEVAKFYCNTHGTGKAGAWYRMLKKDLTVLASALRARKLDIETRTRREAEVYAKESDSYLSQEELERTLAYATALIDLSIASSVAMADAATANKNKLESSEFLLGVYMDCYVLKILLPSTLGLMTGLNYAIFNVKLMVPMCTRVGYLLIVCTFMLLPLLAALLASVLQVAGSEILIPGCYAILTMLCMPMVAGGWYLVIPVTDIRDLKAKLGMLFFAQLMSGCIAVSSIIAFTFVSDLARVIKIEYIFDDFPWSIGDAACSYLVFHRLTCLVAVDALTSMLAGGGTSDVGQFRETTRQNGSMSARQHKYSHWGKLSEIHALAWAPWRVRAGSPPALELAALKMRLSLPSIQSQPRWIFNNDMAYILDTQIPYEEIKAIHQVISHAAVLEAVHDFRCDESTGTDGQLEHTLSMSALDPYRPRPRAHALDEYNENAADEWGAGHGSSGTSSVAIVDELEVNEASMERLDSVNYYQWRANKSGFAADKQLGSGSQTIRRMGKKTRLEKKREVRVKTLNRDFDENKMSMVLLPRGGGDIVASNEVAANKGNGRARATALTENTVSTSSAEEWKKTQKRVRGVLAREALQRRHKVKFETAQIDGCEGGITKPWTNIELKVLYWRYSVLVNLLIYWAGLIFCSFALWIDSKADYQQMVKASIETINPKFVEFGVQFANALWYLDGIVVASMLPSFALCVGALVMWRRYRLSRTLIATAWVLMFSFIFIALLSCPYSRAVPWDKLKEELCKEVLKSDALMSGRDQLGSSSLSADIGMLSMDPNEFCKSNGEDWLTQFNSDLKALTLAAEGNGNSTGAVKDPGCNTNSYTLNRYFYTMGNCRSKYRIDPSVYNQTFSNGTCVQRYLATPTRICGLLACGLSGQIPGKSLMHRFNREVTSDGNCGTDEECESSLQQFPLSSQLELERVFEPSGTVAQDGWPEYINPCVRATSEVENVVKAVAGKRSNTRIFSKWECEVGRPVLPPLCVLLMTFVHPHFPRCSVLARSAVTARTKFPTGLQWITTAVKISLWRTRPRQKYPPLHHGDWHPR
jgi:hypothetical protein